MLRRWTLENFKPIRGRIDLPVAPLTVLAGLNSSGKSSFLQSILLVAQTLANQRLDEPLVLNGPLVRLGTFQDVCNERAGEQRIRIGFVVEGPTEVGRTPAAEKETSQEIDIRQLGISTRLDAQFEGVLAKVDESAGITATSAVLSSSEMDVRSPGEVDGAAGLTARILARKATRAEEEEFSNGISESFRRPALYPTGQNYLATVTSPALSADTVTALVRWTHFVPSTFVTRQSSPLLKFRTVVADLFRNNSSRPEMKEVISRTLESLILLTSTSDGGKLLPDVRKRIEQFSAERSLAPFGASTAKGFADWALKVLAGRPDGGAQLEALMDAVLELKPSILGDVLTVGFDSKTSEFLGIASQDILTTFTSAIRYVGPLRADPQSIQSFSPSGQPDDVGPRGEYAAAVYAANRKQAIRFFDPVSQEVRTASLEEAMDRWLRHLGVADHVSAREAAAPGVSWMVRSAPKDRERPLSAVGVGVSQVLPILVAGLLSPEGAILVMEQPELHLHERPQARLGDFFYGLTRVGKQVFVETHSAVLIGQLRYRMVKSGQEARDAIAIYFVSQDEQGDAKFEPIRISKRGAIENWPDGFFDESFRQEDLITAEGLRAGGGKRGNA